MYVLYMFIDVKMLTYYFFTIGILIVSSLISEQGKLNLFTYSLFCLSLKLIHPFRKRVFINENKKYFDFDFNSILSVLSYICPMREVVNICFYLAQ